ncbi:hypothetical protein HYN43_002055 [Mucilaginibacter celer]|uniref:Uncharacterized protein n=1 Tax=Mucilaginibacter celer TaxID=2305508 RepID=A0A494VKY3_9SPHI|nr:hypothetical protein HYN43_002055 [Mucilaginibacter celer]
MAAADFGVKNVEKYFLWMSFFGDRRRFYDRYYHVVIARNEAIANYTERPCLRAIASFLAMTAFLLRLVELLER